MLPYHNKLLSGVGETGFNIENLEYNASKDYQFSSPLILNPNAVYKRDNNLDYYVVAYNGADRRIRRYTMSTENDPSTSSSISSYNNSFNIIRGLSFKLDGTKFYTINRSTGDVETYTMSTSWDITTASLTASESFAYPTVSPNNSNANNIHFKPDGSEMYLDDIGNGGAIFVYELSTNWDPSTATYVAARSYTSNLDALFGSLTGATFSLNEDGTQVLIISQQEKMGIGELSTAYDFSTMSDFTSPAIDISSNVPNVNGAWIEPDFSLIFMADQNTGDSTSHLRVYET